MLAVPVAASAQTGAVHRTELVSVSGGGVAGNGVSTWSAISADGRYVAFASSANNLVAGDDNGVRDVFVRDTQMGTTTLVSKATNGTIGDQISSMPSISSGGRYVAFESWANNFGGGATNKADIFLHDRDTGTTSLVSKAGNGDAGSDGSHHPSISADGTRIAFYSYADNFSTIDENTVPNTFVHDTDTAETTLVSRATGGAAGDDESVNPAISANGQVVAFQSAADNLVAGSPDADNTVDVFARNLDDGTTVYVSKASDGTPGSGDSDGSSTNPSISADGRYVAFASRADTLAPDDALFLSDVFVHDLDTAETTYVSKASDGTPGTGPAFGSFNPSLSADGRYVAFDTTFTNLSDLDVDGVDVNDNEVADVFVHDRQTGDTRYVSRSTAGVAGNKASYLPRISGDGSYVAFESHAETLTDVDAADQLDVFMHKLIPEPPADNETPVPGGGPDTPGAGPDAPGVFPPPGGAADSTAPRLSKVAVTRKRFRVGRGKSRGTTLRFGLSERAAVRVVVQRRKGKRWRTAGTIRKRGVKSGRRALRITGRFGHTGLASGRYRIAITATDAAGNRSATVHRVVRVVR
jgi:Tol biopolymer transport system component